MAGLADLVQGFECNRIAPGGLGGHVAFERQPGVLDGRVLVQGQTRRSLDCVQGKERLRPCVFQNTIQVMPDPARRAKPAPF